MELYELKTSGRLTSFLPLNKDGDNEEPIPTGKWQVTAYLSADEILPLMAPADLREHCKASLWFPSGSAAFPDEKQEITLTRELKNLKVMVSSEATEDIPGLNTEVLREDVQLTSIKIVPLDGNQAKVSFAFYSILNQAQAGLLAVHKKRSVYLTIDEQPPKEDPESGDEEQEAA